MPIGDIAKGWKFGATMQLRTPLRVLTRHGEIHERLTDLPAIAREQWEGYWTPLPKSHAEMGIPGVPEILIQHMMASSVGPIPIDGGEYLKFLMRVRAIVEVDSSIEDRRTSLREELRKQEWQNFCIKLGGNQNISDQFFPPFIYTIKGLPSDAIAAMWEAGLTTPMQLEKTNDTILRAIKGIGPAKLAMIRAACSGACSKNSEFLDNVCR